MINFPGDGSSPTKKFYTMQNRIAKIIFENCKCLGIEEGPTFNKPWNKAAVGTKSIYREIASKVMPFTKWGNFNDK